MAILEELQAAVTTVADTCGPAVVRIGGWWRGGSGVVIADGRVLTNAHNVRGSGEVTVTFADGRSATGTVAGVDADGDLAVITVDTAGASPVAWGSSGVNIGHPVFAVTAASEGSRVTFGLVSAMARSFRGPRGRRISGSIEHTAPMAPGSSGSALVDAQGALVGLNTNRLEGGLYLALPADDPLRTRIDALARGETPSRPRLGVGIAPGHVARRMRRSVGLPERDGLLVRDVEEAGPPARAGIAQGDLLVAANGKPLTNVDDLYDALGALGGQSSLELTVVRGAEERKATIDLTTAD